MAMKQLPSHCPSDLSFPEINISFINPIKRKNKILLSKHKSGNWDKIIVYATKNVYQTLKGRSEVSRVILLWFRLWCISKIKKQTK